MITPVRKAILAAALAVTLPVQVRSQAVPIGMVRIPAGTYAAFYAPDVRSKNHKIRIETFLVDARPVNGEFLTFVKQHPEWRKSAVKPVFADSRYLNRWRGDLLLGRAADAPRPVTGVSWFAASAYCKAQGKSLPTTDQWEYALADSGRNAAAVKDRTLAWYASADAAELPAVGSTGPNGFGVYDLVGLVWEWTLDFNSFASDDDRTFFCGGGSLGVSDISDFPAFMRYSLRASLRPAYTTNNLGFRCAGST